LRDYLELLQRSYVINHRLVRGLDYYTKTVFEVWAAGIGAQAAVCGGGRYDGLIELLGGTPTPGVGVAVGVERIVMVMKNSGAPVPSLPVPQAYLAHLGSRAKREALRLSDQLRGEGVRSWFALGDRGLRSQMREADKRGARFVVILGDDELEQGIATVREMSSGMQQAVDLPDLVRWLAEES
jgi:histidyl-tRNA synthetase